MINLQNVCYEYTNKKALDDISFNIEKGSITALVGPNGAGKTTLMNCITALEEPFSGLIEVDGLNTIKYPREVHSKIGYLSDFFGLYKDLTVRQCLEFSAKIHQISPKNIKNRIEEICLNLNLSQYLDFEAGNLSRGFRQVLGIAQALIHNPKILILDEPTSGLDPEARENLSNLFRKLQKEGMTILVSSHIISELEEYCQDMILLREGKLIEHCKKDNFAKTHNNEIKVRISLLENSQKYLDQIIAFDTVNEVQILENEIEFNFNGNEIDLNLLLKKFILSNIPIFNFTSNKQGLKDIYLKHTNK
jgi:ABC-2 type transport system ATP-binding protein